MRRSLPFLAAALLVLVATSGCAKKENANQASGASSDSLLASNPIEPPAGNITPQSQMSQQTPEQQQPPAETAAKPKTEAAAAKPKHTSTAPAKEPGISVDAGTPVSVSVGTQISSETAKVGDPWSGEIKENVIVGDRVVFPAGSVVSGTIAAVKPAEKG